MSDNKRAQPAQAGLLLPFWLCCLDSSKGQSGIKAGGTTQDALERLFPPSHERPFSVLHSFTRFKAKHFKNI